MHNKIDGVTRPWSILWHCYPDNFPRLFQALIVSIQTKNLCTRKLTEKVIFPFSLGKEQENMKYQKSYQHDRIAGETGQTVDDTACQNLRAHSFKKRQKTLTTYLSTIPMRYIFFLLTK